MNLFAARRPRLFAEIPAGLAAVSLQLQGGRHARPPVSRQGNKAGYAHVILDAFGLRPGQGADAYLWVEADEDVAALLRCYPNPDALRAVAEIIRSWRDEEPRALWLRLRDERRQRQATEQAARYAVVQAANRLINVADDGTGQLRNTGKGGTTFGGADFGDTPEEVAVRVEELAGFLTTSFLSYGCNPEKGFKATAGGSWPDQPPDINTLASNVAEYSFLHQGSFQYKGPEAGIGRPEGMEAHDTHGAIRPVGDILGDAFPRLAHPGWPHVAVSTTIPAPPDDAEGCVLYMDPDYVGTTGYRYTLPRADVVRIATAWAAAGAIVAVSESVAVEELTALGWDAINIAGERRGQKRTFAANAGEWLTTSRPPVSRPAIQPGLFQVSA